MMQRYSVKFKDFEQNSYEVKIYRDDYVGNVTELRAAPSAFVVSYEDDDFIYKPLRASSATLRVIGSELMLDLYSINSQYAPVKLYKNGALEWTGYIKPEQFTQPYTPTADVVSVECVSAISTLENTTYKKQTDNGFITMKKLLQYLIREMHGEFSSIVIPWTFGNGIEDYFSSLEVIEGNYLREDPVTLLSVLEQVCYFLNLTVTDIHGVLYFVDWDWKGEYRAYNEMLTEYSTAPINEVRLQDIGMNGSYSNTIDVVHGYNKATVKSVNNIFENIVDEEEYNKLPICKKFDWLFGLDYWKKEFLSSKNWKVYSYDEDLNQIDIDPFTSLNINDNVYGAILMREASFQGKEIDGVIRPDVSEYPWYDAIQVRWSYTDIFPFMTHGGIFPLLKISGASSIWKDGAITINTSFRIDLSYGLNGANPFGMSFSREVRLRCRLRIGDSYYNGESWTNTESMFDLKFHGDNTLLGTGWVEIDDDKNPEMPYEGAKGKIIELPQSGLKGQIEFTLLSPDMSQELLQMTHGLILKDLKIEFVSDRDVDDEGEDGDRIYENVVNEDYMSECDEISFGIGSYNKDGATYSKVLYNGNFLENNLFCRVVGENMRPEELMVRRIVNRYKKTKIKLTESVKIADSISPLTILSDRSMVNNSFRLTSSEWDYEQNRLTVQMQEDTNG